MYENKSEHIMRQDTPIVGVHWSACVRNNLLVSCRGCMVTSTSEQMKKQTNKQKEKPLETRNDRHYF